MRNKIIAAILLSVITLNSKAQAGITVIDSIISGGIYRKFRLYVPNSYTAGTTAPLILNLHGYTSNALQQQAYANFMPIADTAKFLVVQPDGTYGVGGQFWNAGIGGPVDDVLFLKDLMDSLSLIYTIDQTRIYSCGMSNGGIMSYYLACNLPNRIAAIASVAGSMFNAWYSCAPIRAFPVMEIHGTNDATVNYLGDVYFAPIDSVVKKWRVHNLCNPAPITYSVPDINLSDNTTAVNYKYTGGIDGTSVEFYKINGGSHSWPGAAVVIGDTNEDFNASAEIWRFFRGYKLNQFITAVENRKIELSNLKVYPNPSTGEMTVDGIEDAALTVFSFDGKKLLSQNSSILNLENLESGLYFLEVKSGNFTAMVKVVKE